ncbi:MAG: CoA-binding protein [Candidatus Parcubacteria bacterium]|nr:CoA-binding protein [Candidatus Parcubacteria bacterium]
MKDEELQEFIDKNFIYAIVGATINQEKYGYKVLVDLKRKGYNVVPINPKYGEVAGLTCYPDLIVMDERPDVVVLIVGEENAKKAVQACIDLNLNKIWFQPGSEYGEAVKLASSAGFDIVIGKCIMQETAQVQSN